MVCEVGFLDKIKNILFEEEEVEIPIITKEEKIEEPVKAVAKEEPVTVPHIKEEPTEEAPLPVKKEHTFDFPIFDEEEFEENKARSTRTANVLEYERKRKEERKPDFGARFDVQSHNDTTVKKPFRPSPVISPVYGILDKNYKKEDLMPKDTKKKETEEKVIDVDRVREKAFGTLEDDIERTLNEPVKSFYDAPVIDETHTVDELLMENADVTIPVTDDEDTFQKDINDILEDRPMIEDVLPEEDVSPKDSATLEVLDEVEKNLDEIAEKSKLENDTLESDLFDLIDSMYEQREDSEA